ncbi:hypothetical protein MHSWG343_09150 [Candidatus Mycoplasma haematohominis]|uniref:Uncharacterized protein n=1 Tax=Candidatus Mycoplasma haematohominis TaxID=1494318 RepID=A0A478FQQ8_9MOLU|nr:hypothetical protein MHSWG343_09150 [Candidatus Mycoplasma haemohominis]
MLNMGLRRSIESDKYSDAKGIDALEGNEE